MWHTLGQGIVVAGVDFVLVFIILGGLAGVIKLFERFVTFWEVAHPPVSSTK